MLLIRFGALCADDIILHRIVPTLLFATEDVVPQVRAAAIRALRSLLMVVRTVDAIESNIFPQYIFPALSARIAKDTESVVRVALAESLGRFAETAKRFLDQAHLAAQAKTVNGDSDAATPSGAPDRAASDKPAPLSRNNGLAQAKDPSAAVAFHYDVKLKSLHDQVVFFFLEKVNCF